MAKDDYFVIVYQVLKYLYDTLKQGYQPDPDKLTADYLGINRYYWGYIIQSLLDEGFIKGVKIIPTKEGLVASRFEGMQITPKRGLTDSDPSQAICQPAKMPPMKPLLN